MSKANQYKPFEGLRVLELASVFERLMAGSFFPTEWAIVLQVGYPTLRDMMSSLKFQYKIKN